MDWTTGICCSVSVVIGILVIIRFVPGQDDDDEYWKDYTPWSPP